jgi:hypothetical protein
MIFDVLIDDETIRPNPHAGQKDFHVPGKQEVTQQPDGRYAVHHDITTLHSLSPEPSWLFSYRPTVVACDHCHEKFPDSALESDDFDDSEGGGRVENICPRCGEGWCCILRHEKIEEALTRTGRAGTDQSIPRSGEATL